MDCTVKVSNVVIKLGMNINPFINDSDVVELEFEVNDVVELVDLIVLVLLFMH